VGRADSGTKRISYLEDNLRAPGLDLSAEDNARLEQLAAGVHGDVRSHGHFPVKA